MKYNRFGRYLREHIIGLKDKPCISGREKTAIVAIGRQTTVSENPENDYNVRVVYDAILLGPNKTNATERTSESDRTVE